MFVDFRIPFKSMLHSVCVYARAGCQVDARPTWKRQRGRPRNTWVRQVELDSGITADAAWTAAADRDTWRALWPTAGHAVQSVSELNLVLFLDLYNFNIQSNFICYKVYCQLQWNNLYCIVLDIVLYIAGNSKNNELQTWRFTRLENISTYPLDARGIRR